MAGLGWPVPNFSTPSRRKRTIERCRYGARAALPPRLAPESSRQPDVGAGPYGIADRATTPEAKLRSRCPDRQAAEIHIRIALTNRFSALDSTKVRRVAWTKGKGDPCSYSNFCNNAEERADGSDRPARSYLAGADRRRRATTVSPLCICCLDLGGNARPVSIDSRPWPGSGTFKANLPYLCFQSPMSTIAVRG